MEDHKFRVMVSDAMKNADIAVEYVHDAAEKIARTKDFGGARKSWAKAVAIFKQLAELPPAD